ncbi:LpxL/LpxP family acyltransferase [Marinomonas transparens]|uniref:Lipid A biosynthesis acyltransferase n=1 Tax=Marinomonas transparens TaxID=2795388 RepID=A0A934JWV7_9GAMM|nr:lipid A biosynthesis acyltransferase [Marinomonas transparens]MBJ7538699.1 lipid A biosynthesis acyltransferase [Marinomonas transparens]
MADRPQHWSNITETSSILGMKILLTCYQLFGHTGFRLFLAPVILYFYIKNASARAASKEYLTKIAPFFPIEKQKKMTSLRHFFTFGEMLLDKFLVWMGQIEKQDIVFETAEAFKKIKLDSRGGIIVVSHLGNTEICNAIGNQLPDVKVTMLVHTKHAQKFNKMMQKTKSKASFSIMQVTEITPATAMILSERVANGEYVVITGDRTPVNGGGRVSHVDFLGSKAALPQGPFILASLLACPVYLMFCLKQDASYHIYVESFSEDLACHRKERQQKLEEAVTRYARRLEHYCLLAPLQWFNFFPFWQSNPSSDEASAKK